MFVYLKQKKSYEAFPFYLRLTKNPIKYHMQGFIQDFQFGGGGGDVVCGLTGMGEYFSQVTPRNGAKSIVVSFC